ncbi:hypothetical protein CJ010_11010 [Azoarcus sp. DD4]|nr:hypothetical protein CJ010_11010 [Azoarcus sp. DD4]
MFIALRQRRRQTRFGLLTETGMAGEASRQDIDESSRWVTDGCRRPPLQESGIEARASGSETEFDLARRDES